MTDWLVLWLMLGFGGSGIRDAALSSTNAQLQSRGDFHVGSGRFIHFPLPRVAPWSRPHQFPFMEDFHYSLQSIYPFQQLDHFMGI